MVQSMPLLDGKFNTTTNVTGILNLAKDIGAMRDSDSKDEKWNIYTQGLYATDESGSRLSLASLSLNAAQTMSEDPLYNIYRYAFLVLGNESEHDPVGYFDGEPVDQYAHTIVDDLFELNATDIEAEAALAMGVWMSTAHEVNDVLRNCLRNNATAMNRALDRAAAFWIGADQPYNAINRGNSLYNLAAKVGTKFGRETIVNSRIVYLLTAMQNQIRQGTCGKEAGYIQMRTTVRQFVGNMTIPLVQSLIYHIVDVGFESSSDLAELFALSFAPRVAACDPTAYKTMLDILVFSTLVPSKQAQAMAAVQQALSCLDITCDDVGKYQEGVGLQCQQGFDPNNPTPLASYVPSTNILKKSYIDRDILQIRFFMEMQAYDAALDLFKYGYNSDVSLQQLASTQYDTKNNTMASLFYSYYKGNISEPVLTALRQIAPFNDASKSQLTEVVVGLIRYVIMFLVVIAPLEAAIDNCDTNPVTAAFLWDTGAAYYIGSIEGSDAGGQSDGQLLFAAAKDFCSEFLTCRNDDALVNLNMINALEEGKQAMASGSCNQVSYVLYSTILRQLPIIPLQGTLLLAYINEVLVPGDKDGSLGEGYAVSRAVLPILNEERPMSAAIVARNLDFQLTAQPVSDGSDAVFEAVTQALPFDIISNITIDCDDLGIFNATNATFCLPPGTMAPSPSLPPVLSPVPYTDLAFGRYVFQTNVTGDSNFAIDVKEMYFAKNVSEASAIYTNGKNAKTAGLNSTVGIQSLASLSKDALKYMGQEPLFNIYRYALLQIDEYDDNADPSWSAFGDVIVRQALNNAKDVKLASLAAVVMNVFSLLTHKLSLAVEKCENKTNAAAEIDSAVALWIGQGQIEGRTTGWMLYAIAQQAWSFLGNSNSEAAVNSALMELFADAQDLASSCSDSVPNFVQLRIVTERIVEMLSLPLLQNLLYYISTKKVNMVELYGLSVIPQALAVAPPAFTFLDGLLFDKTYNDGFLSNATMLDEFIANMASFVSGMRFSCDDFDTTSNADGNYTALVNALCEKLVERDSQFLLAGYEPTSNVAEQSRIDLDIIQIGILIETGALDAAKRYYRYGRNSFSEAGKLRALQELATSNFRRVAGRQFDAFAQYFGSENYTDTLILSALEKRGVFAAASRAQIAEIVVLALKTMVTYQEVCWRLVSAVTKCTASQQGVFDLDIAVAYYVGSIEGGAKGGDPSFNGQLMYSLAKEMCPYFGTCTESGEDANINTLLIDAFTGMKDALRSSSCTSANNTLINYVFPSMPLSLVQGLLYFAYMNSDFTAFNASGSIGSGFILADSILPLINASRPSSAVTIKKNMNFSTTTRPVPDGAGAVFDAVAAALDGMGISCDSVGIFDSNQRTVCTNATDPPVPNEPKEPSNFFGNTYVSSTYVQDVANIALDVRDMEEALNLGHTQLATEIYRNGKNSDIFNSNGVAVDLRTLSGFSTNATADMLKDSTFNLFRYALQDSNGLFDGKDAMFYANTTIEELLSSTSLAMQKISVEGVAVLNVWMYLVHHLYATLDQCKNKNITGTDGLHLIDVAVAYWVGDGDQGGTSADSGHLMYGITERMGAQFNTVQGGQAQANTNILQLFTKAKNELSFPNACSSNPNTYPRLIQIVNKIIAQMTIPLIQGLIHNLLKNDRDRTKLYARAFVPLVVACNPTVFNRLYEELILMTYNVVEVNDIITLIKSTYDCFGLRCADIGLDLSQQHQSCIDTQMLKPMAGYIPSTDVRKYALMDLDILEMDILMRMEAYSAAKNLYTYGKHAALGSDSSSTTVSLAQLAITSRRTVVPQFDSYVRYFNNDQKYADTIVQRGFDLNQLQSASNDQRRELIIGVCQYMIMHMAALQAMYEAVGNCDTSSSVKAFSLDMSWDKVAAFLIGSLEGSTDGGSPDGRLLFGLADAKCQEFGTCSSSGHALVVDRIISLLYTGRGARIGKSCSALRKAANEIEATILVPLIQGSLSAAYSLQQIHKKTSIPLVSDGYVLSRSVLPLVANVNRDAANAIATNLDLTLDSAPVPNGAAPVFAAFTNVYAGMGVDCQLVGETAGINACIGPTSDSKSVNNNSNGGGVDKISLIVGVTVGGVALLALVWLLCCAKRKNKEKSASDADPVFVKSNGEFNYGDTELLNGGEHNDASPAMDDDDQDHENLEEDTELISSVVDDPSDLRIV